MTVQILKPDCNLETIRDGRGGIFTWIPKEPIVEFNMLYFNPGKVRGFHFHPHFIEYLLVVDGNGTLVTSSITLGAANDTSRLRFCFDGLFVLFFTFSTIKSKS